MVELKYYKFIFFIFLIILTSCDFFNTRDPESPEKSNSQYLPQTSYDAVIKNFIKSFSERNTEFYTNCFIDSITFLNQSYSFFATNDIKANFPATFDNWNINNEKQFITMLKSKYSITKKLIFILSNPTSDFHTDSIIYNYNYYCEFDSSFVIAPRKYSGLLQLTISKNNTGQWGISKWIDYKKNNDTIPNTISFLKAKLSN